MPDADVDGDQRIYDAVGDGDATVDMGADEVILSRPKLSEGGVSPSSGEPLTTFRFIVKYAGGYPSGSDVVINGTSYAMNFLEWDGGSRVYYYDTTLTPDSEYYFFFEDGNGCPARLPEEGAYDGPAVSNVCPSLAGGSVSPPEGGTATVFRIEVSYQDPDGTPPKRARVIIDNVSRTMDLLSGTADDGTYILDTPMEPDSTYYFSFDDGYGCTVRLPDSGTFEGPVVTGFTTYVPDDHSDILTAVTESNSHDVIIVRDGLYTGEMNKNIEFNGKVLTVRSESGPLNCIIDCEGSGRGFYLNWESAGSVIEGFTIANGSPTGNGGAISSDAMVTISNCRIIGNSAANYGGGIFLGSSTAGSIIINGGFDYH
jgi:hypothetical protein